MLSSQVAKAAFLDVWSIDQVCEKDIYLRGWKDEKNTFIVGNGNPFYLDDFTCRDYLCH